MTQRLYYDDAYLREFTARVTHRSERDGSPAVALDRSAFYPAGGGQPGDHGRLNNVAVIDTQADEASDLVWHILESPLAEDDVHGAIDWMRRFDFMQQHHGQHLLSAAAARELGARTLAVHLGESICTVDLDRDGLTSAHIAALEDASNAMIWADVPIHARFVDPDALEQLTLRKPPQVHARIRVVSAGDFDHSACGGTHPRRTGEVGCVVIRRWERYKGGTRVEFVCGGRALRDYRIKNNLLLDLAARLSVGISELPAAIDRVRTAEARARAALERAEERLLDLDAQALIDSAERIAGVPVVVAAFDDRSLDRLRGLARCITARGAIALLGGGGDKAQLVFARPPGVTHDMAMLVRESAAILGGRGGGRPEAAQGGGPHVTQLDKSLWAALARIRGTTDH